MKEAEKLGRFCSCKCGLEAGVSRAQAFVVYIARAPSNYCADATPTRGVWSQIY